MSGAATNAEQSSTPTEVAQGKSESSETVSLPPSGEALLRAQNKHQLVEYLRSTFQMITLEALEIFDRTFATAQALLSGAVTAEDPSLADSIPNLVSTLKNWEKKLCLEMRPLTNQLKLHFGSFEAIPPEIRALIHDAPKALECLLLIMKDRPSNRFKLFSEEGLATVIPLGENLRALVGPLLVDAVERDHIPTRDVSLKDIVDTAYSQAFARLSGALGRNVSLPRELEHLIVPGSGLLQIVANELVTNAADAIASAPAIQYFDPEGRPTKPCIDLSIGLSSDTPPLLRLTVANEGPVIPDAVQATMFDPGFTTKVGGTGQGLSIIKSAICQLGGDVSVTSIPSPSSAGRTTFTVTVPLS